MKVNYLSTSSNENIDMSLFLKCIENEDTWKLFNYDQNPQKIYFLNYLKKEKKILIRDEKNNIIFFNDINHFDTRLLNCTMKKITK